MDATKLDQAIVTFIIAWVCGMVVSLALAHAGHKAQEYMAKQKPMGGAKLSQRVVNRLRQLGDKCDVAAEARKYQIHPKTVRRILAYETWEEPEPVNTDDEHKQCLWCGGIFERRYTSGRWRTDEQWEAKRTCNASCNMYLMWKDGVYINRQH